MARIAHRDQIQTLRHIAEAVARLLPPATDLTLEGQTVSVAELLATLNVALAADTAVTVAETQLAQAQRERDAQLASALASVRDLKQSLRVSHGSHHPLLVSFGFAPKPRRELTPAEQAIAAALRLQTREVRGTKGRRQRLAISAEGKPGLLLLAPDGTPIPGKVLGPSPPSLGQQVTAPAVSKPPPTG